MKIQSLKIFSMLILIAVFIPLAFTHQAFGKTAKKTTQTKPSQAVTS